MPKQVLDISTSTILRVFAVLLVLAFLFSIWQILASIFLAVVIASALEPALRVFTKAKIPRFIAAILVYIIAISILASVFYAVIPTLVSETRQLSTDLPTSYQGFIYDIERFFGREPGEINAGEQLMGLFSSFQESLGGTASNIFTFTFTLFGGLLSFILVFVTSFYLLTQRDGVERLLKSFVPKDHQEYIINLWERVHSKLGRWFQGQILLGIFVGVLLFVALRLLGVKYALSIAFMAGVFEIIPVIGPITAGLIALVLISFQSPMLALYAILAYVLIEQVQNNLLLPSVMSKTTGLNPIIIIIALLVGANLAGAWGLLLAIPVSITIAEFLKDLKR